MEKVRIFVELVPFDKKPILCTSKAEAEQVSVQTGGTAWYVMTEYFKNGLPCITHMRYNKATKKWVYE